METESKYEPPAIPLYNPEYMTDLGIKIIKLNGQRYEVHETSNLRVLLDVYFHQQAGAVPVNFLEEVTAHKLSDPVLIGVLTGFLRLNPELGAVVRGISQQRDLEYHFRSLRRETIGQKTNPAAVPFIGPSDKESARRDFVYSQVLDHIGDMTIGTGFDLTLLVV